MPASAVYSLAKRVGLSTAEAEKRWEMAKAAAEDQGHNNEYDYIMGVYKKMIGLDESQQLEEAVNILLEAPKPDYWRTMDSGHRVGFEGTPGKGKPVAGNPKVLAKMRGKGKGKTIKNPDTGRKLKKVNLKHMSKADLKTLRARRDRLRKKAAPVSRRTGKPRDQEADRKSKNAAARQRRALRKATAKSRGESVTASANLLETTITGAFPMIPQPLSGLGFSEQARTEVVRKLKSLFPRSTEEAIHQVVFGGSLQKLAD